jgi:hypothetical protein
MAGMKGSTQLEEGEELEGYMEEVDTWDMFLKSQHSDSLFELCRTHISPSR